MFYSFLSSSPFTEVKKREQKATKNPLPVCLSACPFRGFATQLVSIDILGLYRCPETRPVCSQQRPNIGYQERCAHALHKKMCSLPESSDRGVEGIRKGILRNIFFQGSTWFFSGVVWFDFSAVTQGRKSLPFSPKFRLRGVLIHCFAASDSQYFGSRRILGGCKFSRDF